MHTSIGILSAAVAGFTVADKANTKHIMVLSVIDGPDEPKHMSTLLDPLFQELQTLCTEGMQVFNAYLGTSHKAMVAPGLSTNDLPASSKIGAHASHSAYLMCRHCWYRGVVCGCKTGEGEDKPIAFDNENYVSPLSSKRHYVDGTEVTQAPPRKKRQGEHIAWTDRRVLELNFWRDLFSSLTCTHIWFLLCRFMIPHTRYKKESHIRANMAQFDKMARDKSVSKSKLKQFGQGAGVTGKSAFTVFDDKIFHLSTDLAIDGMHLLIRGVTGKLMQLTFGENFKSKPWSVHFTEGAAASLDAAMRTVVLPIEFPSLPVNFVENFSSLHADEIFCFARVFALPLLKGRISSEAYQVWCSWVPLLCGLCCTSVPKSWVNGSDINSLQHNMATFLGLYAKLFGRVSARFPHCNSFHSNSFHLHLSLCSFYFPFSAICLPISIIFCT
jgi:hypothetical protein